VKIRLITIGNKAPSWVSQGFDEYRKRLPREWRLELVELPMDKGKGGRQRSQPECELLLKRSRDHYVVALDERGRQYDSRAFADRLAGWLGQGRDLAIWIGGANGLHQRCRERADELCSLSRLTYPHSLTRVVLAEQLYRAWSILQGHPYHRD
jgi:23S rRNA (pseudouridine1915-N3)-methyltransferase